MRHYLTGYCALGAALFLLSSSARADLAVAPTVSTLGVGIDVTSTFFENVNVRFGGNYFRYNLNHTFSTLNFDMKAKWQSGLLFLDWHPNGSAFRISAGGVLNDNKVDLVGKPMNGTYNIGGTTYTAAQVGNLTGKADFNKIDPYLGVGYGNALSKDGHWTFAFDLGVMYEGSPKISYHADGTLSSNSAFQTTLDKEAAKAKSDVDQFKFYPLVAIGVAYSF